MTIPITRPAGHLREREPAAGAGRQPASPVTGLRAAARAR
jgi:hypothetical protein